MKILFVEDDPSLGEIISKTLQEMGRHNVVWVKNANNIKENILTTAPDIIVLDLGLPGKDGLDAISDIRVTSKTPIIVSTARDNDDSIDRAFKAGADDYIIKPYRIQELLHRIHAIHNRATNGSGRLLTHGELSLNRDDGSISYQGNPLDLSRAEHLILETIISHPKKIFTRGQLENTISSLHNDIESNSIDVHIHNIRKKTSHEIIKTIRGLGYTLGIA